MKSNYTYFKHDRGFKKKEKETFDGKGWRESRKFLPSTCTRGTDIVGERMVSTCKDCKDNCEDPPFI